MDLTAANTLFFMSHRRGTIFSIILYSIDFILQEAILLCNFDWPLFSVVPVYYTNTYYSLFKLSWVSVRHKRC